MDLACHASGRVCRMAVVAAGGRTSTNVTSTRARETGRAVLLPRPSADGRWPSACSRRRTDRPAPPTPLLPPGGPPALRPSCPVSPPPWPCGTARSSRSRAWTSATATRAPALPALMNCAASRSNSASSVTTTSSRPGSSEVARTGLPAAGRLRPAQHLGRKAPPLRLGRRQAAKLPGQRHLGDRPADHRVPQQPKKTDRHLRLAGREADRPRIAE